MAVADGNSQLTAHPGEPILWFLNVHESQTATRASQRVSSQHASKTNTVLPPSLSHLEMVPQMVHCMWQRKKIPIFFFSLPKPTQQQATVRHPAVIWGIPVSHAQCLAPCQRQGKGERQLPKSALRIPTSWGDFIQGLNHMKNMSKSRVKTL